MEHNLNGRKALVTGGASGIGAACARELAARGAKVVVADVDSAGAGGARWWSGRIINVSSAHGIRASPFKSAYVAAKHGLEGLSKVTALEGGERGVTSNCINPGYVRTPLVEKQIADQAQVHGIPEAEVLAKVMLTESAIKRLVEPEEVASLVAWLASDRAGMVTGASYTMDGGWSAR